MAEILQYIHKDGFFHRLHPITKIVMIALVGIASILTTDLAILTLLVAALFIAAYFGKVLYEISRQSVLLAVMSVIMIAIAIVTIPGGSVLGYLVPAGVPIIGGSIPVTTGALEVAGILTLRFVALITLFQIVVISTQPRDIVQTMEQLRVPAEYTLMFVIALRFIPTLQLEAHRIHEAQLARGYNPGKGFIGKIRSLAPIMVPLVSNALGKANVLGFTIDLRGYRNPKRTALPRRPFSREDNSAYSCLFFAVTAVIWYYILI
jgi:energy-coupling factor transport system permease protein